MPAICIAFAAYDSLYDDELNDFLEGVGVELIPLEGMRSDSESEEKGYDPMPAYPNRPRA